MTDDVKTLASCMLLNEEIIALNVGSAIVLHCVGDSTHEKALRKRIV